MALLTRSSFYYGHVIDETNFALDFDEGVGEVQASLTIGDYTLESFLDEIARSMNEVGTNEYTVNADRSTRIITISSTGTFSLLANTGSRIGVGVFALAGYDAIDTPLAVSATGENASGFEFRPQFLLQNFVALENRQEKQEASINVSASGITEVVSFGNDRFTSFDITYITEKPQAKGAIIENNENSISEARQFAEYIIEKNKIEFNPDRDNPDPPQSLILEATSTSRTGTGFELRELFNQNIAEYYALRGLNFREITP